MNKDLRTVFKSLSLSLLALVLSVGVLYAATTIGSNISTAGTLLVNNATSTITNLVMVTATSTNATTTTLYSSSIANLEGGLFSNAASSTIIKLVVPQASTTALSVEGALMVNNASSSVRTLHMVNASSTAFDVTRATSTAFSATTGQFGGTLSVGTTTVSGSNELVVSGAAATDATTTLNLSSGGAWGSCIQMTASGGASTSNWRIYISTVPGDGDNLAVEKGVCK